MMSTRCHLPFYPHLYEALWKSMVENWSHLYSDQWSRFPLRTFPKLSHQSTFTSRLQGYFDCHPSSNGMDFPAFKSLTYRGLRLTQGTSSMSIISYFDEGWISIRCDLTYLKHKVPVWFRVRFGTYHLQDCSKLFLNITRPTGTL